MCALHNLISIRCHFTLKSISKHDSEVSPQLFAIRLFHSSSFVISACLFCSSHNKECTHANFVNLEWQIAPFYDIFMFLSALLCLRLDNFYVRSDSMLLNQIPFGCVRAHWVLCNIVYAFGLFARICDWFHCSIACRTSIFNYKPVVHFDELKSFDDTYVLINSMHFENIELATERYA